MENIEKLLERIAVALESQAESAADIMESLKWVERQGGINTDNIGIISRALDAIAQTYCKSK